MRLLYDILHIFYPRTCLVCDVTLNHHEKIICSSCDFKLPRTRFHDDEENVVNQVFWGRVWVSGTAFLFFRKENVTQRLLHHLKYRGRKDIGVLLGELFAYELLDSSTFKDIDVVIPVPLHPGKKKKRGFNQSAAIAKGISVIMGNRMNSKTLYKIRNTDSQTRKTRIERWENVKDIFGLNDPGSLEGMNILVIDDVITTGATMESCLKALSGIKGVTLFAAAIGFAST